jgi:hypothetical protein
MCKANPQFIVKTIRITNDSFNFRWRDYDLEGRLEKFTECLKLVRFPLMQPEEFAEFVVPSGVLSKDDVIEVLIYFLGKGYNNQ